MRTVTLVRSPDLDRLLGSGRLPVGFTHRVATRVARRAEALVRADLERGAPPPPAPLTLALRPGDRALWDTGELAKSIRAEVKTLPGGLVQVRLGPPPLSRAARTLAILERGVTIRVTRRMARMFQVVARAAEGGPTPRSARARALARRARAPVFAPREGSTLRIPPRPVLRRALRLVMADPQVRQAVRTVGRL